MRVAALRKQNSHIGPLEFERPYSCGEDFSRMWKENVYNISVSSIVTTHLDQEHIEKAVRALAEIMRETCFRDVKQHIESRGAWMVCNETFIRIARPEANTWERLPSHFHFRNSKAVIEFLEHNIFLVDALLETRKKIDYYFGAETESSLEIFTDPEDDHHSPTLFALIHTPLSSDDASTRLDRLDQDWWLNQPYRVKRNMNIDVEYVDGSSV